MKKIYYYVLIMIILLIFIIPITCNAETIKYEDWKTGEMLYYDVHSYSDLYSVFEDLDFDYGHLIEEYHSLERTIEEQQEEIAFLESELKDEQIEKENLINPDDLILIFIPFVIYVIALLISKLKDKTKK